MFFLDSEPGNGYVHSYHIAVTCEYSKIFLSFVKSVKLCVLAVATMIRWEHYQFVKAYPRGNGDLG